MTSVAISSGKVSGSYGTQQLMLTGTVSPGATVTILDQGRPIGAAAVDPTGAWTYSGAIALQDHYLSALATDSSANTAETLRFYAKAGLSFSASFNQTLSTTFSVTSGGIDVTEVVTSKGGFSTTTANHYSQAGILEVQTKTSIYRTSFNNTIEVTTAADANGVTTYSRQYTSPFYPTYNNNIVKNYYDADFHILKQETYAAAGALLSILTAPDASGNSTLTDYSVANQIIVTGYDGTQKAYANHYDLAMTILGQDRFDTANRIVSSTTAADANGHLTATDYDQAHGTIAQIDYTSANTTLNALHHVTNNTQSANYQIYTGDGILPIGFTTSSTTAGDTFTFTSAYTTPSHTTILGFDPQDHVVLNGYDPTHVSAQEDGTNVTLTLSDQSVVFFDHVAHVADLHLVWT